MGFSQKQIPVNPRHMRVIDEYFKDFNKTQAMIRAGYSRSTAERGTDVFQRREVKEEIERRQKKMSKKAEVDADYVIAKFKQIVEADLGDILTIQEDGSAFIDLNKATPNHLASIGEFTVDEINEGRGADRRAVTRIRVKLHDKLRALEALGRYLGLFKDKVEIKGEMELMDRIQRGRAKAFGKREDDD